MANGPDEDDAETRDPLLDEIETQVFYGGPDDPRNGWVRIEHRESGIEIEATDAPTQQENLQAALAELRRRLNS